MKKEESELCVASVGRGINSAGVLRSNTIKARLSATSGLRYHVTNLPFTPETKASVTQALTTLTHQPWVSKLAIVLQTPSGSYNVVKAKVEAAVAAASGHEYVRKDLEKALAETEEGEGYALKTAAMNVLWDALWREEHSTYSLISCSGFSPGDAVKTPYGPGIMMEVDHTLCDHLRQKLCVSKVQLPWGVANMSTPLERCEDADAVRLSRKRFIMDSMLPSLAKVSSAGGETAEELSTSEFVSCLRKLTNHLTLRGLPLMQVKKVINDYELSDRVKAKEEDAFEAVEKNKKNIDKLRRLQLKRRLDTCDWKPVAEERELAAAVFQNLTDFAHCDFLVSKPSAPTRRTKRRRTRGLR